MAIAKYAQLITRTAQAMNHSVAIEDKTRILIEVHERIRQEGGSDDDVAAFDLQMIKEAQASQPPLQGTADAQAIVNRVRMAVSVTNQVDILPDDEDAGGTKSP